MIYCFVFMRGNQLYALRRPITTCSICSTVLNKACLGFTSMCLLQQGKIDSKPGLNNQIRSEASYSLSNRVLIIERNQSKTVFNFGTAEKSIDQAGVSYLNTDKKGCANTRFIMFTTKSILWLQTGFESRLK